MLGGWNNLAMLLLALGPAGAVIAALAAGAAYLIDWPAALEMARGALTRLQAAVSDFDIGRRLAVARGALASLGGFLSRLAAAFAGGFAATFGALGQVSERLAAIFSIRWPQPPAWLRRAWKWATGAAKAPAQALQARAAGGPFGPGPLLVGERGPELMYASRAGFVAHNDNLQRIVDLSRRAAASLAGASVAAHMALMPPAIEPATPPASAPMAASADKSRPGVHAAPAVRVHYAPQITVHGNTDAQAIKVALDQHLDDLVEAIERRAQERERLKF